MKGRNMSTQRKRFKVAEVAAANGFHVNTIYQQIYAGTLEAVRIGRAVRIDAAALEAAGLAVPELEVA